MQEAMQQALSPVKTRPGTSEDAVDDVVPRLVASPRTLDELRAVVAFARQRRLTVVAAGGGTSLALGNRLRAFDVLIRTRDMGAVVERTPEDMTVTVEAELHSPISPRRSRATANGSRSTPAFPSVRRSAASSQPMRREDSRTASAPRAIWCWE
jgi:hypothetical protein